MSEAHENWVTNEIRRWLLQHSGAGARVDEVLAYIESGNTESGNWSDGREVLDEDIEYAGGELKQYAVGALAPWEDNTIQARLIRDSLSETDWSGIATSLIYALVAGQPWRDDLSRDSAEYENAL